jgi:hypothetical protein
MENERRSSLRKHMSATRQENSRSTFEIPSDLSSRSIDQQVNFYFNAPAEELNTVFQSLALLAQREVKVRVDDQVSTYIFAPAKDRQSVWLAISPAARHEVDKLNDILFSEDIPAILAENKQSSSTVEGKKQDSSNQLIVAGLFLAGLVASGILLGGQSSENNNLKATLTALSLLNSRATNTATQYPTATPTAALAETATYTATAVPPTETHTPVSPTATPLPPTETATSTPVEKIVNKDAVWPGEFPFNNLRQGAGNSNNAWSEILANVVSRYNEGGNADSLLTSLKNPPKGKNPLIWGTQILPDPSKEYGKWATQKDIESALSVSTFWNIKDKTFAQMGEVNTNGVRVLLIHGAAHDKDATSLGEAAWLLGQKHVDVGAMTPAAFLEALKANQTGVTKYNGELAQIQAQLMNKTQDHYLGTSQIEKNRRVSGSGDMSAAVPEQFQKSDQIFTCDVKRLRGEEREEQLQKILQPVSHLANGKETLNQSNTSKEGIVLVVAVDPQSWSNYSVAAFTDRFAAPEDEYKVGIDGDFSARGDQELPCGVVKPAETNKTPEVPKETPKGPTETPGGPTPTPPREPSPTYVPTNRATVAPTIVNTQVGNATAGPTQEPTQVQNEPTRSPVVSTPIPGNPPTPQLP